MLLLLLNSSPPALHLNTSECCKENKKTLCIPLNLSAVSRCIFTAFFLFKSIWFVLKGGLSWVAGKRGEHLGFKVLQSAIQI